MYLLDKNNNELLKFDVDLGRLIFLGKELHKVTIYTYPIIIFEFMTGYFTTEEIFNKNKQFQLAFAKEFEIVDIPKDFQKTLKPVLTLAQSKSGSTEPRENRLLSASTIIPSTKENQMEKNDLKKNINPDNKTNNINSEESKDKLGKAYKNITDNKNNVLKTANTIIGTTPVGETQTPKNQAKEKLSKSVLPKLKMDVKVPYFDFVKDYQMLSYYINPQETENNKVVDFKDEFEKFKEGLENYRRKLRILRMEKEIEYLNKKNDAIKEISKNIEEAIKHKKENLQNVEKKLKPSEVNYNFKLNQLNQNLKGRGRNQLIYDSFVYQKMVEVCFVFFNNKIQSLYSIPYFYNEPIISNDQTKLERFDYYNNNKKYISSMMGHICQLLIYLSKTYNIPLRYPLLLNGSKCSILKSIKDKDKIFLPLYLDINKMDRHGNFENALNCLKDDIKEIFNFFSLFPEIISKSDTENINQMNQLNGKHLFFYFFVVFNHSLFRFMKILQNN